MARRTVQRYLSISDRETLNPTPENGDMAYMAAEGSNLARVAFYDGDGWVELAQQYGKGQLYGSNIQEGVSVNVTTAAATVLSYTLPTIPGRTIVVVCDAWFRSNVTPDGSTWYGQIRINGDPTLGTFVTGTSAGSQSTAADVHMLRFTPTGTSIEVEARAQILSGTPSTFYATLRTLAYVQ